MTSLAPDVDAAFKSLDSGELDRALEQFKACVDRRSPHSDEGRRARLGYGATLLKANRPQEAGDFFLEQKEGLPEYMLNAAIAFQRLKQPGKELIALARLLPRATEAHAQQMSRLLQLAKGQQAWAVAKEAARKLYTWFPGDVDIRVQLALMCRDSKCYEEAIPILLELLQAVKDDDHRRAGLHSCLAGVYKDVGQQTESLRHFRASYDAEPSSSGLSNLIMMSQYSHGVTLAQFYDTCAAYSRRYLRPLPKYVHPVADAYVEKAQLGLSIGFVSGDFTSHSLAHLLLEPFKRLKAVGPQHTFSVWNSREHREGDVFEKAYLDAVHFSHNIHGMDDAAAAKLIHDNHVDVLVDISGHTALNRLPVFGRRPSPVQAGWVCGMMTPAGVEDINYFFTDRFARPESAGGVCREKLFLLPSAYTYFPLQKPVPDVAPLPAEKNGYVSFGSLNNPCKLSPAVLSLWAECLREVPESVIKIKTFNKETGRQLQKFFADKGVAAHRVVPVLPLPSQTDVLRYYTTEIDIVLEPFPCAGCLTTAEAMWMGCPAVARVMDTFLSRQSVALLAYSQLEHLAAATDQAYVAQAVWLSADVKRLAEIRGGLRARLTASPIRDPVAVAQGVVSACEAAWVDWCASVAKRPPLPVALG